MTPAGRISMAEGEWWNSNGEFLITILVSNMGKLGEERGLNAIE